MSSSRNVARANGRVRYPRLAPWPRPTWRRYRGSALSRLLCGKSPRPAQPAPLGASFSARWNQQPAECRIEPRPRLFARWARRRCHVTSAWEGRGRGRNSSPRQRGRDAAGDMVGGCSPAPRNPTSALSAGPVAVPPHRPELAWPVSDTFSWTPVFRDRGAQYGVTLILATNFAARQARPRLRPLCAVALSISSLQSSLA